VHKDPADGCTEFEEWLHEAFTAQGSFTTLVVLVWIGETQVAPLASTYCNIIGDETNWAEIVALFDGAGQDWNGAAFFPVFDAEGLLEGAVARFRLRQIEERVRADRLVLKEGEFFDKWGRRLKIDEVTPD
jgi:hypothetical protein